MFARYQINLYHNETYSSKDRKRKIYVQVLPGAFMGINPITQILEKHKDPQLGLDEGLFFRNRPMNTKVDIVISCNLNT